MKIHVKCDQYGDVIDAVESDDCPRGYETVGDAIRVASLEGIAFQRKGEPEPEAGGTAEYVDRNGVLYSRDCTRGTYGELDVEKSNKLFQEQDRFPFEDWEFDEEQYRDVFVITFEWDGSGYKLEDWTEHLK